MRKTSYFILAIIIFAYCFSANLSSEPVVYGDYSIDTAAVINEDDYSSLLNPLNIAGLNDVTLSHSLNLKFAAGDESVSLELWAGLSQAYDPVTGSLSSMLNNLNLQRAGISWYMGDNLKFKLGRHSMLTGYGYGWNPVDFANPLKNPADPSTALDGVDVFMMQMFPESMINIETYVVFDSSSGSLDYKDINPGAEITVLLPIGEAKITGIYDRDIVTGEDDRVSALGAGLFMDIAGLGVYGEAAVLDGSRTRFADDSGNLSRKTETLFNALGGLEYTFESGLTAVFEYFYNGEGYNRSEMSMFADALETKAATLESAPEDFLSLAGEYRQGYYSRHYLLLNLLYSLYELNIDLSGTVLFAADSGSLTVLPRLTWWASGGLSIEVGWAGLFDLYNYRGSEAELSPADNAITLSGNFSF